MYMNTYKKASMTCLLENPTQNTVMNTVTALSLSQMFSLIKKKKKFGILLRKTTFKHLTFKTHTHKAGGFLLR